MHKFGLDSSNLKTEAELEGKFLEDGQLERITFPNELNQGGEWRVKEWFFEKGEVVNPGDILGAVENKEQRFEFETFVGGKLNYFKQVGQRVEANSVLAEIAGFKKN